MRGVALALALAACGGATPPPQSPPQPPVAVGVPGPPAPGPAPAVTQPEPPQPGPTLPPRPAPWSQARLPKSRVPAVFLAVWKKAANRRSCPLLVPTDLGPGGAAKPRPATFYGGWAVAYDGKGLPGTKADGTACATCGRSAFGVAGTGADKTGATPFATVVHYDDGSELSFGQEGGTGPGWLAYVTLPDAACLYNVWSAVSQEHLLQLVDGLRRAEE